MPTQAIRLHKYIKNHNQCTSTLIRHLLLTAFVLAQQFFNLER